MRQQPAQQQPAQHEPAQHEPAQHEPAQHEPAQHEPAQAPVAAGLRYVGRVQRLEEGGGRYAFSGAGFSFRFYGTTAIAHLTDPGNWHSVRVDGRLRSPLQTRAGTTAYVLVQGLELGEHVVEVTRRTEALFGPTHLQGVEIPGGRLLPPPAAATLRLEVVGDSISCGYGIEGQSPQCPFSAETQNHDLAYGALLARALSAELSTVAWSGRGVVKNYASEPGLLMPAMYERALPEEPNTWSFVNPAHVVIVNLGTNDFSTEPDPEPVAFQAGYAALLEKIRRFNPTALIVCTLGPMLAPPDQRRAELGIRGAVRVRAEAGDSRVLVHVFETPNTKPGCDFHPGLETHAKMSRELSALLVPLLEAEDALRHDQ